MLILFALCISSIGHHYFIHQLVLFCQHGVTMHGPIWHYLFEVGHFHYMMDEHISEYSSFEAFCISVCSSSHTGAYPLFESIGPSTGFIHFWSSCRPRELHIGAYPPSPSSSNLSQASLSFDLVVDPHELSYWGISSSTEFACIVIWVIIWLWTIWSGHSFILSVSI